MIDLSPIEENDSEQQTISKLSPHYENENEKIENK